MYASKFEVKSHKLYECGLCGNPYPYMCEECNMDVKQNMLDVTAKEWQVASVDAPVMAQEDRMFIGSGDIMTWEAQCGECPCETCKMHD